MDAIERETTATNTTVEVGATGRGPDPTHLTRRLADAIARYRANHRDTEPLFQRWSTGTEPAVAPPSMDVCRSTPARHVRAIRAWPLCR
jgi:protein-L-isoaspartate(D-aspartate) O-methyltransferase